jgi:hypothetical protein
MLGACGTIDNAIRSEESIKEKAAFSLGTTPDKVTISNRRSELGSVKFNATANGRVFQCYYTTAGVSSDALCSPTDGAAAPASKSCNALLKAAGMC